MKIEELLFFNPQEWQVNSEGDDKQILRALTHPNVVLQSVDNQTKETVLNVIRSSRAAKKELVINIIFGAYKSINIPSPYLANWAEVIHLRFMLQILAKIAGNYPYAVILEYILQDSYLDKFNVIPNEEVDQYINSFYELVNFYNKWLITTNQNIQIRAVRESEIIDRTTFDKYLHLNLEIINNTWRNARDQEAVIAAIERAKRNIRKANPTEHQLYESALLHAAYIRTSVALDVRQSNDKILLVHRKLRPEGEPTLPFRSCSSSAVQFWIGEGVLMKSENKVYPTIISPYRLQDCIYIEEIHNTKFEFTNANLSRIYVYANKKSD